MMEWQVTITLPDGVSFSVEAVDQGQAEEIREAWMAQGIKAEAHKRSA